MGQSTELIYQSWGIMKQGDLNQGQPPEIHGEWPEYIKCTCTQSNICIFDGIFSGLNMAEHQMRTILILISSTSFKVMWLSVIMSLELHLLT